VQVSNDTTSVIDTDTAVCGIAGIEYRVLGIAHHYQLISLVSQVFFFVNAVQTFTRFCLIVVYALLI
jgi:hypothetical protein